MAPTKDQINLVAKRFIHRRDAFAIQWYSKQNDEGGFKKQVNSNKETKKITPQDVRRHLQGNQTLGIYAIALDGTVKWLCLDVDITKGAEITEVTEKNLVVVTKELSRLMTQLEIPHLCEHSGRRGYHLWVFLPSIEAKYARALGRYLVACIECPQDIHIEIFPKQSTTNSYGNLIKLPLGIHKKTNERCLFVDKEFAVADRKLMRLQDQWKALEETPTFETVRAFVDVHAFDELRDDAVLLSSYVNEDRYSLKCMTKIMEEGVKEGARDNAAFKLACFMKNHGLSNDMALAALGEWNSKNSPSLSHERLVAKVNSAYKGLYSHFPCKDPSFDPFCSSTCRFYESKMQQRNK